MVRFLPLTFLSRPVLLSFLFITLIGTAAYADRFLAKAAFERERYDIAAAEYSKLVADGDAEAAFVLGHMYLNGLGVSVDRKRGLELMRLAVKGGHAEASSVVCYDSFEKAKSTLDYMDVLLDCTLAGEGRKMAAQVTDLRFDRDYSAKSRYRAGAAYERLGEQYIAFLCYLSAYMAMSDAQGVGYSDETRIIEKRFAVFNLQAKAQDLVGTLTGRQPDLNEVVPPCNISRFRAIENWKLILEITMRGTFQ